MRMTRLLMFMIIKKTGLGELWYRVDVLYLLLVKAERRNGRSGVRF